jgi:hypothetical protein
MKKYFLMTFALIWVDLSQASHGPSLDEIVFGTFMIVLPNQLGFTNSEVVPPRSIGWEFQLTLNKFSVDKGGRIPVKLFYTQKGWRGRLGYRYVNGYFLGGLGGVAGSKVLALSPEFGVRYCPEEWSFGCFTLSYQSDVRNLTLKDFGHELLFGAYFY